MNHPNLKKPLNINACPLPAFNNIFLSFLIDLLHIATYNRPVARIFYREVPSNEETDQMRLDGQVSRGGGGGELCLSETELRSN